MRGVVPFAQTLSAAAVATLAGASAASAGSVTLGASAVAIALLSRRWAAARAISLTLALGACVVAANLPPAAGGQQGAAAGLVACCAASGAVLSRRAGGVALSAVAAGLYLVSQWPQASREGALVALMAVCVAVAADVSTNYAKARVRELERKSQTDYLTGALNRRGLEVRASGIRSLASRHGSPSCVAVIDLDSFKGYNDRNGHPGGDLLLRALTQSWTRQLREEDLLARIGGDEFCLVLPGVNAGQAQATLTRMREEANQVTDEQWSHGVSEWDSGEELQGAIERADRLMYQAKSARRQGAKTPSS